MEMEPASPVHVMFSQPDRSHIIRPQNVFLSLCSSCPACSIMSRLLRSDLKIDFPGFCREIYLYLY